MNIASHRSIRSRLAVSFAITPIIMIGLIAVGIVRVNDVSRSLSVINDVNSVKQRYAINFRGSVHDRAISLRDVVLVRHGKDFATSEREIIELEQAYEQSAVALDAIFAEGRYVSAEERRLLGDIKEVEAQTLPLIKETVELQRAGRDVEAHRKLLEEAKPGFVLWLARINKFIDYQEAANKKESVIARGVADGFGQLMIWLCLVSIGLAAVVGYVVVRSITLPLRRLNSELGDCSGQIGSASRQLTGSSQALFDGSSSQAASLEEIGSSLEELASMTKRNAESAQVGKTFANEARIAAETGAEEMARMQSSMNSIQQSSQDISKIIKTIDEIAFQTNILALNAAVEAARAGEVGAGFAVVADEVRNLARRAAAAARETADKIADAAARSKQGVEISNRVSVGFEQILAKVREVDARVAEVANASEEQSTGLGHISKAVSQIDNLTQANTAAARGTADSASQLNEQSHRLLTAAAELAALVGGDMAHTAVAAPTGVPGRHLHQGPPTTTSAVNLVERNCDLSFK